MKSTRTLINERLFDKARVQVRAWEAANLRASIPKP